MVVVLMMAVVALVPTLLAAIVTIFFDAKMPRSYGFESLEVSIFRMESCSSIIICLGLCSGFLWSVSALEIAGIEVR